MKRISLWLSVLLLCFLSIQSNAFWSKFGYYVHQNIDNDVFKDFENLELGVVFSKDAKAAINDANQNMDEHTYHPYEHFDSDQVADSFDELIRKRDALKQALTDKKQQDAWTQFGGMLHTIQDFYSHSTWIWIGNEGIVDFGEALTPFSVKSPPIPDSLANLNNGGCGAGPNTPDANDGTSLVTTGFYKTIKGFPSDTYVASAPDGKCEHGSLLKWNEYYRSGLDLSNNPRPRPGIALDDKPRNDSGNTDIEYIQKAEIAKNRAIEESTAFVKQTVAAIQGELGICAVCLLTDQQDTQWCKDASAADPRCGSDRSVLPKMAEANLIYAPGLPDRLWAQIDLFKNLSWNEISAVCPPPTGECREGGILNGLDMTGMTWASWDEVFSPDFWPQLRKFRPDYPWIYLKFGDYVFIDIPYSCSSKNRIPGVESTQLSWYTLGMRYTTATCRSVQFGEIAYIGFHEYEGYTRNTPTFPESFGSGSELVGYRAGYMAWPNSSPAYVEETAIADGLEEAGPCTWRSEANAYYTKVSGKCDEAYHWFNGSRKLYSLPGEPYPNTYIQSVIYKIQPPYAETSPRTLNSHFSETGAWFHTTLPLTRLCDTYPGLLSGKVFGCY